MLTAGEVVDTYYLDVRCMLLEIAATLDRLDRADVEDDGSNVVGRSPDDVVGRSPDDVVGRSPDDVVGRSPDRHTDERVEQIYESLELLAEREATPDRSERLLNLFSD